MIQLKKTRKSVEEATQNAAHRENHKKKKIKKRFSDIEDRKRQIIFQETIIYLVIHL